MTTVEYIINGVETFKNDTNANYIQIGSETINATGTIINPKYLSAMVANSVNPTNLNLVNALSVASATTSPAYTINLQSAPAGVGSLWGIDYETTTGEDLQFTTSSATAGVLFSTVGNDNTTRIKNGRVAISGLTENAVLDYNAATWANTTNSTLIQPTEVKVYTATTSTAITPTKVELLEPASFFKKSTFEINQWQIRSGATALTQFDPTEINITNGNDTSRVSTTEMSTTNATTGYASSMGSGVSLNTLSNIGTRISNAGINLGWNTGTSTSALTLSSTTITNTSPALSKTWESVCSIGTVLQANVGSVSITGTRLCQCALNGGAAIPAGTYMCSYMVVFGGATTNLTAGFATPNAPITNNSTASGTLYQYGGTYINNTGTSGSINRSGSAVIVFDGVKGLAIGVSVVASQPSTSFYLMATRIA